MAALRRPRYGSLLASHRVLWCAVGRHPAAMAAVLFGSHASVYRTVQASREAALQREHDDQGPLVPPMRTTVRLPTRRRALLALLKTLPRASGWCRTRWSCAMLALTWQATRGMALSTETMRRWPPKANDPHRLARLAPIRSGCEQRKRCEALVCADALESPLLPNIGWAWRPTGTQRALMTPGTNEQHDLAGALERAPGALRHGSGPRQTKALCRERLQPPNDA